jgi:hypothetical protein
VLKEKEGLIKKNTIGVWEETAGFSVMMISRIEC